MESRLNFIEISELLKKKLKEGKKYKYDTVKERYEKEPNLPIHLFCTKNKGKIHEELLLVQILTRKNIPEDLYKRLRYYQFLHPGIKVVLAFPSYVNLMDKDRTSDRNELEKNGIGLWEINDKGEIEEHANPKNVRKAMEEWIRKEYFESKSLEGIINKNNYNLTDNQVGEICEGVARSADYWIGEAAETFIAKPPLNRGGTNFDKTLIKRLFNISNDIVYQTTLKELAEEFFSFNPEDYPFALKWIKKLWKDTFGMEYPDVHEKLEPLLKKLFSWYRDHFLHQFQVFLLGIIIIDGLIQKKVIQDDGNHTIQKVWLMTSTFHDSAQCIELYDQWATSVLKEYLHVSENLASAEIRRIYIEKGFSSNIEHILSSLRKCFVVNLSEMEITDLLNRIRRFFYEKMAIEKNHGIVASISLLKRDDITDLFANIVLPSGVAIAIHDDKIWKELQRGFNNNNKDLQFFSHLFFDQQRVPFLLILCDNIHEWGRWDKSEEDEEGRREANIELKDLIVDLGKVIIQLFATRTKKSTKFLTEKFGKLENIEGFLRSPQLTFRVECWDREKNEQMRDLFIEIKQ